MIAITDSSAYSGIVEHLAPTQNIDLSEGVINQHLTGSAIINSTITSNVKTMLVSIVNNVNVNLSAKTAIANYSGFFIASNGSIDFDYNKVSLDKLTFYVIFRLPYTHNNLVYDDIGSGNTSSTIESPNTWGRYANYIRTLSGSGLKKLKSEGVDFDLPNDYFTTNNGYNALNAIYSGDGASEFSSDLFDHSKAYNKLPASYYRLTQDENPYLTYYKNGNYRKIHWPESGININSSSHIENETRKVYFEREIELQPGYTVESIPPAFGEFNTEFYGLPFYANLVNNEKLESDSSGNYYALGRNISLGQNSSTIISNNKVRYYFKLKDPLLEENFSLNNCVVISKTHQNSYKIYARKLDPKNIAIKENNKRFILENFKNKGFSGLTFGAGFDIGAAFVGAHEKGVKWKLNFNNSTVPFKIHLGEISSSQMVSNQSNLQQQLKDELWSLITKHHPTSDYSTSSKGIIRQYIDKIDVFKNQKISITKINNNEYHLFIDAPYQYFEPNNLFTPYNNVTITNISNTLNTSNSFINSWKIFKKVLLKSFNIDVNDNFNDLDNNMDCYTAGGLQTNQERVDFQNICKSLIGVKGPMSWVKTRNNFDLLRKFQFGLGQQYIWHLRALYNEFYLGRYYNPPYNQLINKGLKVTPNEVEKYIFSSIQYHKGNINDYVSKLVSAINSHNYNELIKIVDNAYGASNRGKLLKNFINVNKNYLFKNVE